MKGRGFEEQFRLYTAICLIYNVYNIVYINTCIHVTLFFEKIIDEDTMIMIKD